MKNKLKSYFGNKSGMTLVEVLTAMAILSLIIFCFTPLFLAYFQAIKVAGDEIIDVQQQSGVLQTVIGNYATGAAGNYDANVSDIALELSTPSTSVSLTRDNNGTSVSTSMNEVVTIGIGSELDSIKGDFLVSDPTDVKNSYTTIVAQNTSSGLICYPKTLTDDFIEAKIIIYGSGGITFSESSYASDFELSCGLNGGISLTNGTDYSLRWLAKSMVELTIYGGGKISFETSPLLISYKDGQHILQVEVDAPSMIMVGEADDEGDYYYYVSRGELVDGADTDTAKNELAIIRRAMNSTDAHNSKTVTLTSAMNDVEWVPAASGDGYNVDSDGEKYGYYVMCGDNGQIRRFWRNNTTGNYYWGGDYTYYTDYNFNQFNTPTYINSTNESGTPYQGRIYSTDTSFKFISQRSMTEAQSGFNVASKEYTLVAGLVNTSTGLLQGLSVVSATYSNDAEFYGPDGMIYYYQSKKEPSSQPDWATMASMGNGSWGGTDVQTSEVTEPTNIAYSWLQTHTDSYFTFNNVNPTNKASYPITLTSVDAIRITGTGGAHKTDVTASSEGSYYFTSTGDGDTSAEGATTNMNYPQSSYTLYCGYIPAFMDLWAENTGNGSYRYPTGFKGVYAQTSDGTFYNVPSTLNRASNRLTVDNNQSYYTKWRMTMGVTPYFTTGTDYAISSTGSIAYYKKNSTSWIGGWKYPYEYVMYYPVTNLQYAITGKFYDVETFNERRDDINALFDTTYTIASPELMINNYDNTQQNITNNEIVDVTISYLSHPFAIAVAANPTDDIVYDYGNVKGDEDNYGQVFYWNNRRETITFLDSASTVIPNGEDDIPVSLMVGYLLGGTVEFSKDGGDIYANVGSVMNNGIVFLRAGNYNVETQNSSNGQTYEYLATDSDGYKLNAESNVFHQFYYLNSRGTASSNPSKGNHIGDLYGADYWQTNRHIQYKSLYGNPPADEMASDNSNQYEYLRSHPLTNTKVNCVAWGSTWNSYPEAMWGTENGTVLSWWVNTTTAASDSEASNWNDRSVDAEFQSYKWVDNVNGKTFATDSSEYLGTIGSAAAGSGSNVGATFSPGSDRFKYFYDKTSQATNLWATIGFISTLETINDIAYDNDMWVAVGDQSDADPADYCASGTFPGGNVTAKAYSDNGRGGSWVNVRYWVDAAGTGKHADDNAYYHWRAVKISPYENYNIVQINNVNGIWVATGYEDANNNEEYDNGERTVVCWTRNPLRSYNEVGGWSEKVQFYANNGASMTMLDQSKVGGINSVATRTE